MEVNLREGGYLFYIGALPHAEFVFEGWLQS